MSKFIDLTGQVFGRLTVLSRAENRGGSPYWLCICVCGKEKIIQGGDLKSGHTKSCGCSRKEKMAGEAHFNAKLTREQVNKIYNDPRSYSTIALEYGVHRMTVARIKWGTLWGSEHLTEQSPTGEISGTLVRPRKKHHKRFTQEELDLIISDSRPSSVVALEWGTVYDTIRLIRSGKSYKTKTGL